MEVRGMKRRSSSFYEFTFQFDLFMKVIDDAFARDTIYLGRGELPGVTMYVMEASADSAEQLLENLYSVALENGITPDRFHIQTVCSDFDAKAAKAATLAEYLSYELGSAISRDRHEDVTRLLSFTGLVSARSRVASVDFQPRLEGTGLLPLHLVMKRIACAQKHFSPETHDIRHSIGSRDLSVELQYLSENMNKILSTLLDYGANPEEKDDNGETALEFSIRHLPENLKMSPQFQGRDRELALKAEIEFGKSFLMVANRAGTLDVKLVRMLEEKGYLSAAECIRAGWASLTTDVHLGAGSADVSRRLPPKRGSFGQPVAA